MIWLVVEFQPLKNMRVRQNWEIISPGFRGENSKNMFELPPPSDCSLGNFFCSESFFLGGKQVRRLPEMNSSPAPEN